MACVSIQYLGRSHERFDPFHWNQELRSNTVLIDDLMALGQQNVVLLRRSHKSDIRKLMLLIPSRIRCSKGCLVTFVLLSKSSNTILIQ